MKIHNSKVHSKKINVKEFPAACDICGKLFDNESNLKKHKKTEHIYHYVKFQCNECDFNAICWRVKQSATGSGNLQFVSGIIFMLCIVLEWDSSCNCFLRDGNLKRKYSYIVFVIFAYMYTLSQG